MTESQQSICTWADATFGVPASDSSIAARALKKMAELVTACVNGEPAERIGEEIADVVIVLARLGRSLGVDVVSSVRRAVVGGGPAAELVEELACSAEAWLEGLHIALDGGDGLFGQGHAHTRLLRCLACLAQTAHAAGIRLPAAIDRKMEVNRGRQWKRDGRGHGSHVKEWQ